MIEKYVSMMNRSKERRKVERKDWSDHFTEMGLVIFQRNMVYSRGIRFARLVGQ